MSRFKQKSIQPDNLGERKLQRKVGIHVSEENKYRIIFIILAYCYHTILYDCVSGTFYSIGGGLHGEEGYTGNTGCIKGPGVDKKYLSRSELSMSGEDDILVGPSPLI